MTIVSSERLIFLFMFSIPHTRNSVLEPAGMDAWLACSYAVINESKPIKYTLFTVCFVPVLDQFNHEFFSVCHKQK